LGFAVILANSMERFLPQKLTGSQLVNIFPAFYGTRSFIAVFKRSRHQRISPSPRPCETLRDIVSFKARCYHLARPPSKAGGPPLIGCPRLWYSIYTRVPSISGGPFRHPQPEDGPYLVTVTHFNTLSLITAQRCNNARWAIARSLVVWCSVSSLNNFTATTPVSIYWNWCSHITEERNIPMPIYDVCAHLSSAVVPTVKTEDAVTVDVLLCACVE
jgi:hypothetical protein